jgi:hypothetical protein
MISALLQKNRPAKRACSTMAGAALTNRPDRISVSGDDARGDHGDDGHGDEAASGYGGDDDDAVASGCGGDDEAANGDDGGTNPPWLKRLIFRAT